MCSVDPLAGYRLRKPKPTPQPCWTPAEADAIVAAAPLEYRPYLTLLRETGCRASEAKYLTWADVDFNQNVIQIRAKDGWRPKSGDQRTIPMTNRLVTTLKSLPRRSRWVCTAPATAAYPEGAGQISGRQALLALKRVLTKLGLKGKLHTFRHAFISQALMNGVPEAVVRHWVGHVDRQIIRLYTHIHDFASHGFVQRFSGCSDQDADIAITATKDKTST